MPALSKFIVLYLHSRVALRCFGCILTFSINITDLLFTIFNVNYACRLHLGMVLIALLNILFKILVLKWFC